MLSTNKGYHSREGMQMKIDPEQRLSALMAIREDVKKVERSRSKNSAAKKEKNT
ncbi:MAG: hypothetical protein KAR18_01560 [Spirochaetes bacterium]|nr:hypothetical protein [Spirochaetota bacterium]